MANFASKVHSSVFAQNNWSILAGPILILLILAMLVLPLPAFLLDALLTFNIVLSLMVLLVSMFNQKTLDFSAFPTILLFATLLRLALNIASTRIILIQGHTGNAAAGRIIEAFGHFLVGGNYAIGIIVFTILIIINFMVITKGAGRIAEVGARFALDGMPGKQMAIDADLNAGLIGENEARQRRLEVNQNAEFYGSMDGASKFVRGDAIAGLLIMAINLVGGLIIGLLQHDMSLAQAAKTYTLLTIGDGLVAQIPALIISTAAGVIVTRVSTDQDVGEQMVAQLLTNSRVMALSAIVIGLMGLIPGMPNLIFILFSASLFAIAWWLRGSAPQQNGAETDNAGHPCNEEGTFPPMEISWSDVKIENVLSLEVGYRLIPMVDKHQTGQLLTRILGIRKKCALKMGFLLPPVHISDNLELEPTEYRILLKGVEIGRGEVVPECSMAINPGYAQQTLDALPCLEPAFGLSAYWINESQCEYAQNLNYTVVDASSVIATHLNHLINQHIQELFSREETQMLIDKLTKEMPKLIDDVIPGLVSVSVFHKVLQNLLREQVSIRDMRSIIDALAEHAINISDAEQLTNVVRIRLGPAIIQQCLADDISCDVIGIDSAMEQLLNNSVQFNQVIEPNLTQKLLGEMDLAITQQNATGRRSVMIVNPILRTTLARLLIPLFPQLTVLSTREIPPTRNIKYSYTLGKQEVTT